MQNKSKKPEETSPTKIEENPIYLNSKKDFTPNKNDDYGYFFFPERFGITYDPLWYEKLSFFSGSSDAATKAQCEKNVESAINNHPGVKLLLKAMKSVGCEMNLLRHFSVERCDQYIKGGFDPSTNQVIICYNTNNKYNSDVSHTLIESILESFDYCRANYNTFNLNHLACTKIILCYNRIHEYNDCVEILSHEMIHAFDYCRAHLDINNNLHVACSEIRAANLTSCSYFDALSTVGYPRPNMRKECVRQKAALSLQTVRNVTEKEALDVVDLVFDRCYNDLEPFGRRIYSKDDCERAFNDRKFFGLD